MRDIRQIDLEWLVRKLPKELVYHLTKSERKFVIAGGYLRSCIAHEKINDIDIFAQSKEDAEWLINELQPDRTKVFVTDYAYSVTVEKKSVQVIHRWTFQNPQAIMLHFDFTVAQACMWPEVTKTDEEHKNVVEWKGICSFDFYEDLAAKRLVYTVPSDPEAGGTMLRVLKFVKRGYTIPPNSLASIIATLANVDFNTVFDKLKEVDPAADPKAPANKYSSYEDIAAAAAKPTLNIVKMVEHNYGPQIYPGG